MVELAGQLNAVHAQLTEAFEHDRFRTRLHLGVTEGAATATDGRYNPMALADRFLWAGVIQPVWEHRASQLRA